MTRTDVLVIGAGPAGIAAATAAAEQGCAVIVLDDNATPGGQIWRAGIAGAKADKPAGEAAAKHRALAQLERSGAKMLGGHRVFDAVAPSAPHAPGNHQGLGTMRAVRQDRAGSTAVRFAYKHAIVATGARERFLPFPGWTLPGVFGAGGLQALAKGGFAVKGKRVLVAGTGPLLLAVAAHLKAYGAIVVGVAEQAGMSQLVPFGASLWSHPARILQGLRYRRALWGVPYWTGCWPVAAVGTGLSIRSVTLSDGRRTWEEPCDLLACGFHLVPNTELAALLGCEFSGSFVKVDRKQRTSLPGVFCVGELTGIAGLEAALVQGEIAGLACAGKSSAALENHAAAEHAFAVRLEKAFALRPELLKLAAPETIVCRCEDVPLSRLIGHTGWTDAKLQTRCGMGPCQGRVCGAAVEALLGWKPLSVRPPLFPVSLEALCSTQEELYVSELLEENA